MTSQNKIQRMESQMDVTGVMIDPPELPQLDHPRKIPPSMTPALTPSPEGSDHPTTRKLFLDFGTDIAGKLTKEAPISYVSMSIGRNLGDLWWRLKAVRIGKDGKGREYIEIVVDNIIDNTEVSPVPGIYKVSNEEFFRIFYLYCQAKTLIMNLSAPLQFEQFCCPYEQWLSRILVKNPELVPGTVQHAVVTWNEETKDDTLELKKCIFFCKKPHIFVDFGQVNIKRRNYFAVVGDTAKPGFQYELRVRILPFFS